MASRELHSFPTRRSSDLRGQRDFDRPCLFFLVRRGRGSGAGGALGHPFELRKGTRPVDRKSTRLNSSHLVSSYAVFCLIKKRLRIYKMTLKQRLLALRRR